MGRGRLAPVVSSLRVKNHRKLPRGRDAPAPLPPTQKGVAPVVRSHPFLWVVVSDLCRPALFDYFYDLVTLTHDVKTVCRVLYAYALEVEVFNGSILVDFDTFNTGCATVKGNDIAA